jgi:predicted transposase/invertase (TIGR01784 family)
MCRVNPKIDLVFKKLFGVDKNKDLLLSLINSMLTEEDKISTVTIKNPYNLPDYLDGKLSVLDIKAEDEKGRRYNIEMQIVGHDDYGLRTLFYLAKAFIEQIGASGKYQDLHKTIVINIVDFEFFEEPVDENPNDKKEKRYHREVGFRDIKTLEKYPQLDYFSVHFVELPKYNNDINKVKTTLERWITFLNKAGELKKDNLPKELDTDEIKKAVEELTIMYLDDNEKAYYERQQIFLMDEKARLESAKARLERAENKGKLEKSLEIAKLLKQNGVETELIIKSTGLSKEQIEKL